MGTFPPGDPFLCTEYTVVAAPRSPAPLRCLCARWGGETRQHRGAGDNGCGSPIWEVISAAPLNYCSLRPARICLYCLAQREERTGLVKAPETPRNCSKYCSYKFSSLLQWLRAAGGLTQPLSAPFVPGPRHGSPPAAPHPDTFSPWGAPIAPPAAFPTSLCPTATRAADLGLFGQV